MPNCGLCVTAYHSPCFGKYEAACSRLFGVHRNQCKRLATARTSPRDQHAPSRNANVATLCGVDEKDVNGNSTGIGLAA